MLRADGGPGLLPGPPLWGSSWRRLSPSPSHMFSASCPGPEVLYFRLSLSGWYSMEAEVSWKL